jgi:hypothetical protein
MKRISLFILIVAGCTAKHQPLQVEPQMPGETDDFYCEREVSAIGGSYYDCMKRKGKEQKTPAAKAGRQIKRAPAKTPNSNK